MRNVFKMALTYHAMLIERVLDTAVRGARSSLTAEGAESGETRKEGPLVSRPRAGCLKESEIMKWHVLASTEPPQTALPPQRDKVMRGNTIFISCHLQGITTMPPRGCYWSRWERAATATPGRRNFGKMWEQRSAWPTFTRQQRDATAAALGSSKWGTWKTN